MVVPVDPSSGATRDPLWWTLPLTLPHGLPQSFISCETNQLSLIRLFR
jgi:hypothetical protein